MFTLGHVLLSMIDNTRVNIQSVTFRVRVKHSRGRYNSYTMHSLLKLRLEWARYTMHSLLTSRMGSLHNAQFTYV